MLMPSIVTSTVYDAANRLTSWGGTALTYDDNGNMLSHGAATYSWNARDELISTSAGSGSFAYDAVGRRTSRSVASVTTSYLHDGMNPALVNGDLMINGFGLDEFYAEVGVNGVTSRLPDGLGSSRVLTADSGAITASYSYTPYGGTSKSGSGGTPFQFSGRENDGAAELYYYRARYYVPSHRIGVRLASKIPANRGQIEDRNPS